MKALYKKILIIGAATLLIESLVIYLVYLSVNAFYNDLTNQLAFTIAEQVKNFIVTEKFDFNKISQYNRDPIRRMLSRFSRNNSKILHILLIDKNNRIVVSEDKSVEGLKYLKPAELELLKTDKPQVINRTWQGNIEILDVIWPIFDQEELQGYLRTVISVKHLENFFQNRQKILYFASLAIFGVILLAVFLTSRIYQANLKEINKAIQDLSEARFESRPVYQHQDEFAPLYSQLNRLYERTLDLNQSFKQSEERVQALMKVIHEGLLIIDMNMEILSYNDYLLELLHIRKSGDVNRNIYQIFQQNPRLLEIYRRARDPQTHAVKKILTLELRSGKKVDVQVHALPITEQKKVTGVIFYFKNLGLIQELEQNLHRSMQFGVISQLASSIGHEIRNPLSSLAIHTDIVGNLALKSMNNSENVPKLKRSLQILNSEIERLNRLINQFFNLARVRDVELSYQNINELLSEILELVQQQAYEQNVVIHKEFASNLPLVNISKDQIKQVIINLILNAFDAMPEGGNVYIRTAYQEGKVVISVRDTGCGIPKEIQSQVFDLYFTTKNNGGGIGLAISKRIVEAHEGKIYFQSEEGNGTVFFIELPTS